MLAAAVHRHLLHHVLAEGGELARHRDIVTVTQSQPPIGSLSAAKYFPLIGHKEQRLRASGNGDWVKGRKDVREHWQLDLGALESPKLVLVIEAPDK